MEAKGILQTHPLLGDRVRLAALCLVAGSESPLDFNTLMGKLEVVTKGNLSVHLKKLEDAGLLEITKEFVDRKPRTTYRCTKSGKTEIKKYLEQVESALRLSMKGSKK